MSDAKVLECVGIMRQYCKEHGITLEHIEHFEQDLAANKITRKQTQITDFFTRLDSF